MAAPNTYIKYHSPSSVKSQNKNNLSLKEVSQFPKGIYRAEALNPSVTQPYWGMNGTTEHHIRDKSIDYIMVKDRTVHPDHFSRFGYPWCPNGYCTANHPGRYNTPPAFISETNKQPDDMAPARFYKGRWLDPSDCSSAAYVR